MTRHINVVTTMSTHTTGRLDFKSIVGSPHLKAMWQFNFVIDVGFIVNGMHPDVRSKVEVDIVTGDYTGQVIPALLRQAEALGMSKRVRVAKARVATEFGSHHTKMMVLFFDDGYKRQAQVVVHTAKECGPVKRWSSSAGVILVRLSATLQSTLELTGWQLQPGC